MPNYSQIQYQGAANDAAAKYGIPPELFSALIAKESTWNPAAVGAAGEVGLTQLMPGTASDLGVNPWVPSQALEGGARYLATQFKKFGNWTQALVAYNAGPGNVGKGNAAEKQATQYAADVLDRAKALGYTLDPATAGAAAGPPPPEDTVSRLMRLSSDFMGILTNPLGTGGIIGATNLAKEATTVAAGTEKTIQDFAQASVWYIVGGAAVLVFLFAGGFALMQRK